MNNLCRICSSNSGLKIVLSCCGFSVCKQHLDEHSQTGNPIIRCNICNKQFNLVECLSLKKNNEAIAEFEQKINRNQLENLIDEIDFIQTNLEFVINKNLDELINQLGSKRDELKTELCLRIDDHYMILVQKIEELKKSTIQSFSNEIESFQREDYDLIKVLFSDDNHEIDIETTNMLLAEKIRHLNEIKKKIDIKEKIILEIGSKIDINLEDLFAKLYIST